MARFLTDHDFRQPIIEGWRRRDPSLDAVATKAVGLAEALDPILLEWAAREGRVVLSHDCNTMTDHAYDRIARGDPVPGVVVVSQMMRVGRAIDELILMNECYSVDDWRDRVTFVPLR